MDCHTQDYAQISHDLYSPGQIGNIITRIWSGSKEWLTANWASFVTLQAYKHGSKMGSAQLAENDTCTFS